MYGQAVSQESVWRWKGVVCVCVVVAGAAVENAVLPMMWQACDVKRSVNADEMDG